MVHCNGKDRITGQSVLNTVIGPVLSIKPGNPIDGSDPGHPVPVTLNGQHMVVHQSVILIKELPHLLGIKVPMECQPVIGPYPLVMIIFHVNGLYVV